MVFGGCIFLSTLSFELFCLSPRLHCWFMFFFGCYVFF